MAELDEGFDPLPALSEPPDPDTELSIQDAIADSATTTIEPVAEPTPLGRAPAYNFLEPRLVPGVAGGPLMTRGYDTLATWIEKCLRTRRGENPAVDPDFGCEILVEDLLSEGEPFDPSAIAEYTAAIERALLVHPRIASVDDFEVDGSLDDDAATIAFHVSDTDETSFPFTTTIGA